MGKSLCKRELLGVVEGFQKGRESQVVIRNKLEVFPVNDLKNSKRRP